MPRAAAMSTVNAGVPIDLTLNAEVRRICMLEGGYPSAWPRHRQCPSCGKGPLQSLFSKHEFNHDQCGNCGFVCVNPYPPTTILTKLYAGAYYTNFREYYEAQLLREAGGSCMTAAPLELLNEMIARATASRAPGDWLDVGGGLGTVANLARQHCPDWTVTLNECNPRSVELAQELFGLEVVSSDAAELRRTACRFDVISAVQVLEHIGDPLPFLASYVALLKRDGILVVIVPQFTRLNAAISRAASPNAVPPFHLSLFREENLRLVLDRVGAFASVEITQFGPPAFSLIHHFDTSAYWDISIPTAEAPVPKSLQIREYPPKIAAGLNALSQADPVVGEHFAAVDGQLYLLAICRKHIGPPRAGGVRHHPVQGVAT
jgi:SAM-dependent methyltransferase